MSYHDLSEDSNFPIMILREMITFLEKLKEEEKSIEDDIDGINKALESIKRNK